VAFLVGKCASAGAAAAVFGAYVLPVRAAPGRACSCVAVATALNIAGVRWTARSAYALVGGTLRGAARRRGASACPGAGPRAPPLTSVVADPGPRASRTAAGLVFFAFAGYARVATLGGEVATPSGRSPRAVRLALGITLVVYLLVASALLVGLGPSGSPGRCPRSPRSWTRGGAGPRRARPGRGGGGGRVRALLGVLVGISRTGAGDGQGAATCRAASRAVGPRGTPWPADILGGVIAALVAAFAGPAAAIALSACSRARLLRRDQRRRAAPVRAGPAALDRRSSACCCACCSPCCCRWPRC
jgi:APA family basic amino acid/polyamine antiporter